MLERLEGLKSNRESLQEELQKKDNKYKKQIEEQLKKIENEINVINDRIEKIYTYDVNKIGPVLALLATKKTGVCFTFVEKDALILEARFLAKYPDITKEKLEKFHRNKAFLFLGKGERVCFKKYEGYIDKPFKMFDFGEFDYMGEYIDCLGTYKLNHKQQELPDYKYIEIMDQLLVDINSREEDRVLAKTRNSI